MTTSTTPTTYVVRTAAVSAAGGLGMGLLYGLVTSVVSGSQVSPVFVFIFGAIAGILTGLLAGSLSGLAGVIAFKSTAGRWAYLIFGALGAALGTFAGFLLFVYTSMTGTSEATFLWLASAWLVGGTVGVGLLTVRLWRWTRSAP